MPPQHLQENAGSPAQSLGDLVDNATFGVYVVQDGLVVYANQCAADLYGVPRDEIVGQSWERFVSRQDRELVRAAIARCTAGEVQAVTREARVTRWDGTSICVETCFMPFAYQGRPAVIGTAHNVSEAKCEEITLRRRRDLLEALNRIASSLHSELDETRLLELIIDEAVGLVNAESGAIGLFRSDINRIVYRAGRGFGDIRLEELTFDPNEGLIGWAFTHGKPAVSNDFRNDPRVVPWVARRAPFRSLAHIPIRSGDVALGILSIHDKRDGEFDQQDIEALEAVADQVAIALRNSALILAANQARETETLLTRLLSRAQTSLDPNEVVEFAITELGNLLQVSQCAFWQREDDSLVSTSRWPQAVSPKPAESPLTRAEFPALFDSPIVDRPTVLDSTDPNRPPELARLTELLRVKSWLGATVPVNGEIAGILTISQSDRPREWTDSQRRLLVGAAHHLGVCLGNARLFQDLRSASERERLLHQLLLRVRTSLDADELLNITVRELGQLLGASRCVFGRVRGTQLSVSHRWLESGSPELTAFERDLGEFPVFHEMLAAGRTVAVDKHDPSMHPELRDLVERVGIITGIAAPVMIRKELVGFLSVAQCDHRRIWRETEKDLLISVSAELGLALHNAELFSAVSAGHERESLICELLVRARTSLDIREIARTAASRLGRLLGASRCLVCQDVGNSWLSVADWSEFGRSAPRISRIPWSMLSEESRKLTSGEILVLGQDDPQISDVARSGLAEARAKSAIAVPMFAGSDFFGFIVLHQYDRERRWTDEEIALLRTLANQIGMAVQNARLFKDLQNTNAELQRGNAELERIKMDLERTGRLKTKLLAKTSRQLRTPVNSIIRSVSKVLDRRVSVPDEDSRLIRDAHANSLWLMRRVSDLLDIGRLEAGRLQLELQPVNLDELFKDVRSTCVSAVEDKGLALVIDQTESLVVTADYSRLRQVLLNLIDNSVSFTTLGEIRITARRDDEAGFAKISVSDTGAGISAPKLARLSRRLLRGQAISIAYAGAGVGIALSGSLIELMGGRMTVDSEGESKGTVVSFTVPLARGPV